MDEKEMKKIDEKGEEKISGGAKPDADLLVKIKENFKKYPHIAYGVMRPYVPSVAKLLEDRREEIKNTKDTKDALASSEPQIEEKK